MMLNHIEILSRVIMDDAYQEAKVILDKAKIECRSIIREGLQRAEELKKTVKRSRNHINLLCNRAKIISQAEFRAKSEILGHKEQILKAILHQIRQEFLSLPERKDYPEVLKHLIINALAHLQEDGSAFICRVNERDQSLLTLPLLQALGEKAGKAISLDPNPVAIAGGVILYRKDRRVLFDNSLEALFERNRETMRCMAAECIFSTVL